MAGARPPASPSSAEAEMYMVDGRHAFVVPMHVSRRKIWRARISPLAPRLEDVDRNATNRPSELIAGCRLGPSPGSPVSVTDTPMVEGVQSSRIPPQVSRRKTSDPSVFTPGAMFDALETNARYRPSALTAAIVLAPSTCMPSALTDTRDVDGEHGSAAPAQVSRTKTSSLRFVSSTIRLSAAEAKATNRPELLILAKSLVELPWTPVLSTDRSVVDGWHWPVAPMQVSRRKMSALAFLSLPTRLSASDVNTT